MGLGSTQRGSTQRSTVTADDIVFRDGTVLSVRRTLRYHCARFVVRGAIENRNAEWLSDVLVRPCTDPAIDVISVDLAGVTFFGAGGLHSLNRAAERASERGRWFSVWDPPPFVRRVLDAGGVTSAMLIEPPTHGRA
ncbi:STAS domain-containing protein [Cryptosporangium phraense]|uniref:STAS domain-containing protein n=1 Tax=Cryptosporangium phraense TaxID=2593070 RepID=A0A545AKU6_9ACTN|nr:STAS domain-containing protein [Cryptosporangium phraense]TQS41947.1 STAS domain-containing protein [Cryptosporangium phraense]